jgi:hypothetical protein
MIIILSTITFGQFSHLNISMKTYQEVVKAVLASSPKGTSLRDVLPEASKEWKRIKAGLKPTKGMASLTMKGKKDFTTKKTSKVFHRKGHYEVTGPEGKVRKPYRKTGRKGRGAKTNMLSEDVLLIEEQPMAGGSAETEADAEMKKEQMAEEMSGHLDRAEETGEGNPNSMSNTNEEPGLPAEAEAGQEGGRRRRRKARKHSRKTSRRSAKKRGGKKGRKTHRRRRN